MASQALTKRSAEDALMPPPPKPKRIKRPAKVLDEDAYTDALSAIIARDFFPGLVESESQRDYLDALDSKDPEWIASAGKHLTQMMTPGPEGRRNRGRRGTSMTPMSGLFGMAGETPREWAGETPKTATSTVTAEEKGGEPEVNTNLSLGAFQQKYTSEDNESFYKLLDKQNQKRAEKYAWMWAGNQIPAARQIAHRERQQQIQAAHEAQNAHEAEHSKALLALEAPDTRKAMPDTWTAKPRNGFMFGPDSVEDELPTVAQQAEERSRAAPKAVAYDNTRMPPPRPVAPEDPTVVPPSPTLSAVRDAVAGRPRLSASEAASAVAGSETPRVNGFAFVDSREPSPEPAPSVAADPDWSRLRLGPGDAAPNPFSIREKSSREALHHRMVDRVARGKRAEKEARETKTPVVPRFTSGPKTPAVARGGLTPAAQRLMGQVTGRTPRDSVWEGDRTPRTKSAVGRLLTPKTGRAPTTPLSR